MYKLIFAANFKKKLRVLIKNNPKRKREVVKALELLAIDPNYPALKSHKVATRNFGERWASRVSGDIRIIWDYDKNRQLIILVLSLGSHSGKHKAYK